MANFYPIFERNGLNDLYIVFSSICCYLTIMAPMPIVANFALSSVSPELMKSDVE